MKKMTSFFISIVLISNLNAKSLNWSDPASIYDHLVEVNKEWLHISPNELLCETVMFKNDADRIQMHLRLVEAFLRQNPLSGLDKTQLENRNRALDILNQYWNERKFPQNNFHTVRQPYFVDVYGTACAVGYLALQTGEADLVDRISKEMNFAYVYKLKNHYPELLGWAEEYGFTVEELALIQPTYPPLNQTWNNIGNGGGVNGKINVMKAFGDEMLYLGGEFSEVDGVSANSIIAWDGNEWQTLGNGVNGLINDIEIDNSGNVYIGGDFYVNGNPDIVNLACWKDGAWHGYKTSNMSGVVYTIYKKGKIFIGGDFEIEDPNGNIIRDLAFVEYNDSVLVNNNGAFSVNGPVYDFDYNGGANLLISGDFTQTAFYSNDPEVNHLETDYLAYWNYSNSNWITGFEHSLEPLGHVKIANSKIYVGSKWSGPTGAGYYDAGIWKYINSFIKLDQDQAGLMHGILSYNNMMIYYGNIEFIPFVGTWSRGIYVNDLSYTYSEYGADFDAPVTAVESFQNQLYFAGDFTSVQGQEFPGLVASPFDGITSTDFLEDKNQINVYHSGNQLFFKSELFHDVVTLNIYNLSGRLVHSEKLQPGAAEKTISTQSWTTGMYIYQLIGNEFQQSGKLTVF